MYDMEIPNKFSCRKGFPNEHLRVGYVWESAVPGHAPVLTYQLEDVRDCDKIFHDKISFESGVLSPRTELEKMCRSIRKGDVVVVHCLSSLGTSIDDLVNNVWSLMSCGCFLQIPRFGIDTSDPEVCEIVDGVFTGIAGVVEQDLTIDSHKWWIRHSCS